MPGFLQLNLCACGHLTPSASTSPGSCLPQGKHWLLGRPGREELNLPGGLKSSWRNEKIYDGLSAAPQEESSAFPVPLPNPPAGMGMALAPETEMEEMLQPPAWLQEVSGRLEWGWLSPRPKSPLLLPPGRMYEQAHLKISAVAISTPANFGSLPFQNPCLTEGIPAASPGGTQSIPPHSSPSLSSGGTRHHQPSPDLFHGLPITDCHWDNFVSSGNTHPNFPS